MGFLSVELRAASTTRRALGRAEHQEALRLALWRMDSWFGPHLAQEAARPFYEYLAFYAQERAYTRILNRIEPGEVRTPSPLLTFRSDLFRLHFQIDEEGVVTSPQVPEGNLLDLAEASFVDAPSVERKRAELTALAPRAPRAELAERLTAAEAALDEVLASPAELAQLEDKGLQWLKNAQEVTQRAKSSYQLDAGKRSKKDVGANFVATEAATIEIGPVVPLWIGGDGARPELLFVRRVIGGERELLQGFVADWPVLSARLLEQLEGLLPDASSSRRARARSARRRPACGWPASRPCCARRSRRPRRSPPPHPRARRCCCRGWPRCSRSAPWAGRCARACCTARSGAASRRR